MGTIKLRVVQKAAEPKGKKIELIGTSLLIMGPRNPFRALCAKIVGHSYFDTLILLLIAFSTILLALESPLMDPESDYA